jgi:hypothetical protein
MSFGIRAGLALVLLALLPGVSSAEELEGRARTWELAANVGITVLDAGFDAEVFGYTLRASGKVPPTNPDNLDSEIATFGIRASYNFTRYFGLELSGYTGTAEIGDNTEIWLVQDFTVPPQIRPQLLAEQTAAAPGIESAIEGREFDYYNGTFTSVFSFNNKPTSRWVWYFVLGGGYFSLDPDTAAFNECQGGEAAIIRGDPSMPIYNPDPRQPDQPKPNDDGFAYPDNPEQIRIDPGCGRAFPTATTIGTDINQDPVVVLGTYFRDSDPLKDLEIDANDPIRQDPGYSVDPDTGQAFLNGVPLWETDPDRSPGRLQDQGYRTFGTIRNEEAGYFTTGGGVRWYFRPRQALRFDVRRHWAESINKNINEFTVGYSITLGKGKSERAATEELPVPESDEEIPPPGEPEGEAPEGA